VIPHLSRPLPIVSHARQRSSTLPTAAIAAPSNNVKNHLSRVLAPILGPHNLNRLVLGLVTRDLNLSTRLLAEIVDSGASGSDDEPSSHYVSIAYIVV
jgi:hypothetical protein